MDKIDLEQSSTIYRELRGTIDEITGSEDRFFLRTKSGRKLFDFSGGPCVSALGHSNAEVVSAIHEQLNRIPYVYSGFWGTEGSEHLGDFLRAKFDATWSGWFGKVSFACSGNEAVDFACRLASQYFIEQGQPRHVIATRKYSFHGTNLLTSAITDDYGRYIQMVPWYDACRSEYALMLPGHPGVAPGQDQQAFEIGLLETYERMLQHRFDMGDRIAAMILEPVGGPPVGAAVPTRTYIEGLRRLCDKFSMLLIFDEVLCGCGRIGSFTAAQYYDVQPDIICLGKALTSGYLPLSAVVLSKKVVDGIAAGTGVTMIGTTYLNHPTSIAAGLACMSYMESNDLFDGCMGKGNTFKQILANALKPIPYVKQVHGLGFLWGVQLSKPDGTPFDPRFEVHKRVRKALYEAGIVTYSKGQTVDGAEDYIIFSPPYEVPHSVMIPQIEIVDNTFRQFNWKEVL